MRSRTVTALAAAAMLALGLTACGGQSGTSAGGDTSTLVIEDNPVSPLTDDFNPFDTNDTAYEVNALGMVYEPLLQFNVMKPGQTYSWLAKSDTFSNGGKTLTFTLQAGVKWNDGQAFTSKDVAFTFDLMRKNKQINVNGINPTDISTPDDHTVVMDFATPQYTNLFYIASTFIVPQHIWSGISNPATWGDAQPVGTGPYKLTQFSAQGFTLGRNSSYWQASQVKIANLRFPSYVSNTTASLALAKSQIDWGGNDVPNIDKTFVAADHAHNKYWFAPVNVVTLQLNVTKAPLNDVAVRQAVSAGIDRGQLSTIGETGYEQPASSSGGLLLPVDQKYLTASLTNDLAQNKSKVGQLLTQDGYAMVNGKWSKNGQTIKFGIEDPSSYSDYFEDANLIAQQLNAQGFDVSAVGTTPDAWTSDYNTGGFQATIHWGQQGPSPYYQYDNWLDSGLTAAVGQSASADQERYSDPQAQAALAEYANTDDPATQQDALGKLQQIVSTQAPVIPLLYGAAWDEYSTAKFTGWPTADNPYVDPTPGSGNPAAEYTVLHLNPTS